jgi:two-component system sensor histidine kinase KdpD
VITGALADEPPVSATPSGRRRRAGSPLPARRRALGWLLGLGGLVLLTVVLANLRRSIELPTVLVLYLALVVATAAVGGRLPAFLAAIGGFLCANWFFTPPFHRLAIADADHTVALVVSLGVAALVSHFVDAAARRSMEEARARSEARKAQLLAEANELRTALLQAVSHDLRTPLASVKASVSSLCQDDVTWSPEETKEFLTTISEETDRLIALVTNLLDMSRIQAGVVQPTWEAVGLEEVLPAALASLGRAAEAVDAELDETLPPVRADAALLERTLANVVGNAARYTPPGSRVRVEAGAAPGRVEVRVIDHGSGIPPTDRERVFQPFQRRDDHHSGEGVGLGLAVARGFVNAMGGTIEIDETPGGGTTVVISLPAA